MSRSVGVVLPAFRPDVDRLRRYVRAVDGTLAPDALRIELDDPEPGLREALADLPATVNAVDRRRGKGAAITAGFEALLADAGVEVLAFADADGATPADSLADVVAPARSGEAALAVGSRRHPDAEVHSHQTFARRHLGDGFAWLARRLLPVALYDYQCGAKAITADGWRAVRGHLYEPGFAWDIELIAMAGAFDLPVVEVPVAWEDAPDSTVDPTDAVVELGRALLRARHRSKRVAGSRVHGLLGRRRGCAGPRLIDSLPEGRND